MRLTSDEIRLVTFVLLAVLAGTATKYYRTHHPRAMTTPAAKQAGK